ncbi:MAG TPA: hypothetical protein VGJ53_19220 [Micromonosporaceae bacterium]
MTGNEFSGVDLDRLADYVGGALDGTPDAAEVERLVADDPAWQAAYAALGPAAGQVRADLAALGAVPEPMPPDVADRLDAALRPATGEPSSHRRRAGTPARGVPLSRSARGRPVGGGPTSDRPPRRRGVSRRWVRWAGVAAVATAVLALGGIGTKVLSGGGAGGDNAGSTADRGAEGAGQNAAAPAAGEALPGGGQALVSGIDYRPETLAGIVALAGPGATARGTVPLDAGQASDAGSKRATSTYSSERVASAAPAELRRLTDPANWAVCLDALTAGNTLYAGYVGPATVRVVDYARFEGRPALVVFFVDGRGAQRVAVVGPHCGEPSAGADVRYATRVG